MNTHNTNKKLEADLRKLWAKGREAWKDVETATGWVESLRGNQ